MTLIDSPAPPTMTDRVEPDRPHTSGRDCWCNPWLVRMGETLLTPFACTIVSTEPTFKIGEPLGMLLHVNREE